MLWMYPKLRDIGCGCYPWYFYQRYMKDAEIKYSPDVAWRLNYYWTEELPEKFQLDFNSKFLFFLLFFLFFPFFVSSIYINSIQNASLSNSNI